MENTGEIASTREAAKREIRMVEGAKVQLRWTETLPKENKNLDPKEGVVFVPAWNWLPDVRSVGAISQRLADQSGQKVYTISSKTDRLGPDASLTEAKGIVQFLTDRVSSTIVIGHSEGGLKAADLVATLEKNNPQTEIRGLVLIDSMSLYKQKAGTLMGNFINDPMTVAPKEFRDEKVIPSSLKESATQLLYGIWQDIKFFGVKYPKKLIEEIAAMSQLNPRLREIKSPILIITGDRDYVSDHRQYVSSEEIDKRVDHASDQSTQGQMYERGRARRDILREDMFPNAENVAMIVLSKGAHHAGAVDIRIDKVAHVVSKIFERMKRPANSA